MKIMSMKVRELDSFDLVYNTLAEQGFDGMAQALELILNHGMRIERERYLQAQSYERTNDRISYANGYKPKSVNTRVGPLALQVPQTRDCQFYPLALEKGLRSERALSIALAEMYVQGVSTRKVTAIISEMCGTEVSSTQVSNAAKSLDDEFAKWRHRDIGEMIYLYLDARYEHIRMDGQVMDCALFTAIGITAAGKREVLGVSVSYSEKEVHWRTFLESLVKRGMYGVKLIISDAHSGLKAAKKAVFPTCPWQRCQFHIQQNAQAYVPKKAMKKAVASDIRAIFNAPNLEEAKRLLRLTVKKYESSAAKLAEWLEANIHESLTVFSFPETHRTKLRTSNLIERLNKTIKRRTHIVGIFPNDKSCLRLVTALLIEINEDWLLKKNVYLSMKQEG